MAKNCAVMVSVGHLRFGGNVRTEECQKIPDMVASYRRNGFKVNHPLVVSEKAGDDGPTYLVLVGNRRGLGLEWLRDNDPEAYAIVLPGGKVPAIVHKGLTVEEEVSLRIDHGADEDRVPLDAWSMYLAVEQLVQNGWDTQNDIALKLGLLIRGGKNAGKPNRSIVQPRCNLARLPRYVKEQYEKLCREGKDSTPVRWPHVADLYKAYNKEYAEHPDADGPKFQAAWESAMTPPEAKDKDTSAKELTPADAIRRSQAANSHGLQHALLAVTQQSEMNLAEIDATILEGESAVHTLGRIRDYLGEKDYVELLELSAKHAEEKEVAQAEATEGEYQHPVET